MADRTLSSTALRADLGDVLDAVEAGERVVVTRWGKPVAVLVSVGYGIDLEVVPTLGTGLEP